MGSTLGWAQGTQWSWLHPHLPLSEQIVKKSRYPRWNEIFEFELEEGAPEALCVEAWDWDLVSRNDFLGKVSILPLQAAPATFSTWPAFLPLCPSSYPKRGIQEAWDFQNQPLVLRDPQKAPSMAPCLFPAPRWCSMSRDCGQCSRRRAGSGCSPTSPRVGRKSECLRRGGTAGDSGPQGG